MTWTPERIEELEQLFAKGLSAGQIARKLGGDISRCAVLGKVNRLGLSRAPKPKKIAAPPKATATAPKVEKAAQPIVPKPVIAKPAVVRPVKRPSAAAIPASNHKLIVDLGFAECRWAVGLDEDDRHLFCAGHVGGEGPYCPAHKLLAYTPAAARKREAA